MKEVEHHNIKTQICVYEGVCDSILYRSANNSIGYELKELDPSRLHPPPVRTEVSGIHDLTSSSCVHIGTATIRCRAWPFLRYLILDVRARSTIQIVLGLSS